MKIAGVNAHAFADEIICPIDGEPMSIAGLGQVHTTLDELIADKVIAAPGPPIRLLVTKYDPRPKATQESLAYVRDNIGLPMFNTMIRYSANAIGAFSMRATVLDHASHSNVAKDYIALAGEFDSGR